MAAALLYGSTKNQHLRHKYAYPGIVKLYYPIKNSAIIINNIMNYDYLLCCK